MWWVCGAWRDPLDASQPPLTLDPDLASLEGGLSLSPGTQHSVIFPKSLLRSCAARRPLVPSSFSFRSVNWNWSEWLSVE